MIAFESVRVLWRRDITLGLYGIPYGMRPGPSPRDWWLARDRPRPGQRPISLDDWIFLGSPGWWGAIAAPDQKAIAAWLAELGDRVPQHPYEWTTL